MPTARKVRTTLQRRKSAAAATVRELRARVEQGRHWYLALLEAIASWTDADETVDDLHFQYLIGGEAFDWLTLAERLCDAIADLIPGDEHIALLFHNRPPFYVSDGEFRMYVGSVKYRLILNYWYGVIVEEALLQANEEEIQKERHAIPGHRALDLASEAYLRTYGLDQQQLFTEFQSQTGLQPGERVSLTTLKEFSYWRFKRRVRSSDPARLASDTRKGLEYLHRQQALALRREGGSVPPPIDSDQCIEVRPVLIMDATADTPAFSSAG